VANDAIGPFPENCTGYGNPSSSGFGYIATLNLSIGTVEADMDDGQEGIMSFDRVDVPILPLDPLLDSACHPPRSLKG
jgi:histidine decarboxylase